MRSEARRKCPLAPVPTHETQNYAIVAHWFARISTPRVRAFVGDAKVAEPVNFLTMEDTPVVIYSNLAPQGAVLVYVKNVW